MFISIIFFSSLFIIFIVFSVSFFIAGASLAPFYPIKKNDLEFLNRIVNLKPGEVFVDLGSGDGRVCRYIAKNNRQAKILGVELALPLYLYSFIFNLFKKERNLNFILQDVLKFDLSKVNVVYTYALNRTLNKKLKDKFLKELPKNARIVSYVFTFNDFEGSMKKYRSKATGNSVSVYQQE